MQNENDPDFEQFWSAYPRKEGKKDALKAWRALNEGQKFAARESIPVHVRCWNAAGRSKHYMPMCGTWLRGERWEDELEMPETKAPQVDWWRSTAGIETKARELGMWPPRAGEDWHSLKSRILAKAA
jgi:hypothetical protein